MTMYLPCHVKAKSKVEYGIADTCGNKKYNSSGTNVQKLPYKLYVDSLT